MRRIALIRYLILIIIAVGISGYLYRDEVMAGVQNFETPKENNIANVDFINGSFEEPDIYTEFPAGSAKLTLAEVQASMWNYIPMDAVPGWSTRVVDQANANHQYAKHIEIDRSGFVSTPSYDGIQHAELNASVPGTLYQVCNTTPGQKLYWEFYHRGREGFDTMSFLLNGVKQEEGYTNNASWKRYYGSYVADSYQTEFAFQSDGSATGSLSAGNFLDSIRLFSPSFLEINKTVETPKSENGKAYAAIGDRVTYLIEIKNKGEAETSRTVLTDILPDGIELIEESITMTYTYADGTTEDVDTTGLVSFDPASDLLTMKAGLLITGAVITNDNNQEVENTDANGTRSIEKNGKVTIVFDAVVTGTNVEFEGEIKNQIRVTYNDLGFERYNAGSDGEIEDEYNVSNIAVFTLRSYVSAEIEKTLDNPAAADQTFIFQIDYRKDITAPVTRTFYAAAAVEKGQAGTNLILDQLMPGYYTVTERDSSWTFAIDSEADRQQVQQLDKNLRYWKFEYANHQLEKSWVYGRDEVTNQLVE